MRRGPVERSLAITSSDALEVGLDRRLVDAGDDDDVVDSGTDGLVDDQLQRRGVDDRQQLLRNGLGRW